MIVGWIWDLVIHFVLVQLANLVGNVDWDAIRAKFDGHLKAILPPWLAGPACAAADAAFAAIKAALCDQADLKAILEDLAAGNYAKAYMDLQKLIIAALGGPAPVKP